MRQELHTSSLPPRLLQWAMGFNFFHFGCLKLFPELSLAEMIASQTSVFGVSLDARTPLWWLALHEIGIGFLHNAGLRFMSKSEEDLIAYMLCLKRYGR